ncbi:hypothetical protein N5D48_15725 [Pseudomonas sp. GD03858]|uniref:hypothetical protein n=1 Tax=unclassified Pseudomonas TaxID=196821 RepID=UPI002447D45C|nr:MULTISPECIES: hypothetical protein [unclassified Pseudomonas]MDH0648922.1 hypothetical protein [Pseudomonas sp. GD03867]MDH0663861.1 hypothetical protein [Pseudomonas sp. GD03858]
MSDWFVLATARNWTAAVVHQGIRVLRLQESSTPPQDSGRFSEWARNRQLNPDFTYVEDHLFVTTVHKSVEWLHEAHKRNLLEPELTESFILAADQSKLVRDIREHFLKYLNGDGWDRDKNEVVIDVNSGSTTAKIDASSVIVTDEGRLIGGRINVQRLMKEAEALHPLLFEQQNKIMMQEAGQRIR